MLVLLLLALRNKYNYGLENFLVLLMLHLLELLLCADDISVTLSYELM